MCTAAFQQLGQQNLPTGLQQRKDDKVADKASDVPLGEGLADAAKTSILTRRQKIEQALADAGA